MKKKVIDVLIEMGMPADLLGFRYIVDFICLLEEPEWCNCKTTAIYQKVAKMNNSTDSSVERSIRTAFEAVLTRGDVATVNKYLTRLNTTNGNLLHVLHLRLTQEE